MGDRLAAVARGRSTQEQVEIVSAVGLPETTSEIQRLSVPLAYTPSNIGGLRPWFICPGCHRRCAKLYHRGHFRCRACHGLVYRSQRENAMTQRLRKASKIRMRLGGITDPWAQFPQRPKSMHRRTYERLRRKGWRLMQGQGRPAMRGSTSQPGGLGVSLATTLEPMEPEQLRRGKEFHRLVQADWVGTVADGTTRPEHTIRFYTPTRTGTRIRRGRIDIFIDQVDDFVSVVEIKATNWDTVKPGNRRKLLGSH